MPIKPLPIPRLSVREEAGLFFLTDEQLARTAGIRIAFSGRVGGVSEGAYASLNLGAHVQDDGHAVRENRLRLMRVLGAQDMPLVVPNQVHGTALVKIACGDADAVEEARRKAQVGADGLLVGVPNVAALLCFADCVPVIVASPTGRFAVVHAGWRGAVAHIAAKAVFALAAQDAGLEVDAAYEDALCAAFCAEVASAEKAAEGSGAGGGDGDSMVEGSHAASRANAGISAVSALSALLLQLREAASEYNVYLGPCIHTECFECGMEVCERFEQAFGAQVVSQPRRVDLPGAVALDVQRAGVDPLRICDAQACTACDTQHWFSYRASGGVCGRHGALAFSKNEVRFCGN